MAAAGIRGRVQTRVKGCSACVKADFRELIGALADELPQDNPVAAFERACAWDSTGHSDKAVPLYQEALKRGLAGMRRRRAVIQMASSLRNIGRVTESAELLTAEADNHDPDAELPRVFRTGNPVTIYAAACISSSSSM